MTDTGAPAATGTVSVSPVELPPLHVQATERRGSTRTVTCEAVSLSFTMTWVPRCVGRTSVVDPLGPAPPAGDVSRAAVMVRTTAGAGPP
ncbi:MAG: hypothetical protein ACRCSL_06065, partial [Microbacterium sp.]